MGRKERRFPYKLPPLRAKNDFTELAEALLCFHAWYKLGIPCLDSNGRLDTATIHSSIGKMLAMVRWYTPRKKGNGWKLQKFHDILHLALDMERFSPPCNFDAGPHESGLCYWAKLPALTSQRRGYNVNGQKVSRKTVITAVDSAEEFLDTKAHILSENETAYI